jgi:hypothetical protein
MLAEAEKDLPCSSYLKSTKALVAAIFLQLQNQIKIIQLQILQQSKFCSDGHQPKQSGLVT